MELESFSIGWWEVMLGGISTLAIYSFLYRENPFYRFFEHLFIGIATAIVIMSSIRNFFWPAVLKPFFGLDRVPFPDGTYSAPYNSFYLLLIIPMCFGLLYYFILTKRYSWIAQIVIGFMLGVGGGLAFKGVLTELVPQLIDSFRPLYVPESGLKTFSNIVFVFTLFTVLSYFFFTVKRSTGGLGNRAAGAGRWLMMGCFGAFFGATIQARMALLVDRLDFLIHDWIGVIF